jgi:hypothetical protein
LFNHQATQEYLQSTGATPGTDAGQAAERPYGAEPSQRFDRGAGAEANPQPSFKGASDLMPQPSSSPQNVDPGSGCMSHQQGQTAAPPDHGAGLGLNGITDSGTGHGGEGIAYMQDRARVDEEKLRADLDNKRRDALDSRPQTPGQQPGFVPVATPSPVAQRPATPPLPPQQQDLAKSGQQSTGKPQGMMDKKKQQPQQKSAKDKEPERKNSDDLQPKKGGLDRGNKKGSKPNSLLNSALGRANAPHLEDENEEDTGEDGDTVRIKE